MELKTLKDLQEEGNEEDYVNCSVVSCKSLRQEAIKWIKKDLKYVKDLELNNVSYKNIPLSNILKEDIGFIRTWMERFNITEKII